MHLASLGWYCQGWCTCVWHSSQPQLRCPVVLYRGFLQKTPKSAAFVVSRFSAKQKGHSGVFSMKSVVHMIAAIKLGVPTNPFLCQVWRNPRHKPSDHVKSFRGSEKWREGVGDIFIQNSLLLLLRGGAGKKVQERGLNLWHSRNSSCPPPSVTSAFPKPLSPQCQALFGHNQQSSIAFLSDASIWGQ